MIKNNSNTPILQWGLENLSTPSNKMPVKIATGENNGFKRAINFIFIFYSGCNFLVYCLPIFLIKIATGEINE